MTSYTQKPSPCSFYCDHRKKKHSIRSELVEIVEMRLSDLTGALAIVAIIALATAGAGQNTQPLTTTLLH